MASGTISRWTSPKAAAV
ncbi:TPA: hypothetical protein ANIA_11569 [Aspergillus nidulans FGSC A4]|uniref:Uncharacterized protein n=1 Tax=Emericella nidulans (strain FGSC A4 / ATCC 38163 / CBS 112.46 / NRRL 194 / M139) TaxID=227321 RepID=C8VBP9_EMENI|nr:TPA: hypothetical protein ANIA_11569 [Aspergillus nidulans FGSC A4]